MSFEDSYISMMSWLGVNLPRVLAKAWFTVRWYCFKIHSPTGLV